MKETVEAVFHHAPGVWLALQLGTYKPGVIPTVNGPEPLMFVTTTTWDWLRPDLRILLSPSLEHDTEQTHMLPVSASVPAPQEAPDSPSLHWSKIRMSFTAKFVTLSKVIDVAPLA